MKAAILEAPGRIRVADYAMPTPAPGDVLLRVDMAALCGTDQRILRGEKAVAVPIIGHELSGTVVELGAGADGALLGRRFAVQTVVGCGRCAACRRDQQNYCREGFRALGYNWNGAFADYMIVPAVAVAQGCLIPLPESFSPALGTMLEPLSCCVNGMRHLPLEEMERVVIFGAGIIGVLNGLVAKARGVREVILVNRSASKLDLVRRLGVPFEHFVNSGTTDPVAWVREHTDGEGVDAVITSASAKSLVAPALSMLRYGGHLSLFAGFDKSAPTEPIDLNAVHYRELHIHGASASVRRDYIEALDLLQSGRIDGERLVTHTFPLADFNDAVAVQADSTRESLKVLIQP